MAGLSGSDPLVFFGAFALLIFIGYAGNLIFDRFRFNDTVLLIALGLLVGPLSAMWRGEAYVAAADVDAAQPIIGTLALILILFGGGMDLKFRDLLHGVGGASMLGLLGFAFTSFGVAAVVYFLLPDVSFMGALVLGAILGGTSALVVMPSLAKMRTGKRTATMLSLESAITDILVVIGTFTLLTVVTSDTGVNAGSVGGGVFLLFLVSLAIGSLAGLLWLWLVPYVREKQFGYMMTLGAALAVFVITEGALKSQGMSEGGGPLAVLAFGILLGNSTDMWDGLKRRVGDAFGKGLARFQGELAFLVRTFFFVYLGILVDLQLLADAKILGVAALVFVAMCLARYLAVAITVRRMRLQGDDWVLWVMMPRGLAAAVLAAIPAGMTVTAADGTVSAAVPGAEPFVAIAFVILVLTNLLTTIGGMVLGKGGETGVPPSAPPTKPRAARAGRAGMRKPARADARPTKGAKAAKEQAMAARASSPAAARRPIATARALPADVDFQATPVVRTIPDAPPVVAPQRPSPPTAPAATSPAPFASSPVPIASTPAQALGPPGPTASTRARAAPGPSPSAMPPPPRPPTRGRALSSAPAASGESLRALLRSAPTMDAGPSRAHHGSQDRRTAPSGPRFPPPPPFARKTGSQGPPF